MEAANAELFATLRGMSDSYKTVAKSHMGLADEAIKDPYQSYINTAMAIPERAGPFVSMWFDAQRRISDKASVVFNSLQETLGRPGAKPTEADYARMSEALERVGYGNPYRLALNDQARQAFEKLCAPSSAAVFGTLVFQDAIDRGYARHPAWI
jgi:hypothetical protein